MDVFVNGEAVTLAEGTSLAQLIEARGLAPEQVAAEVNKALVPRDARTERALIEGDRIELVTLVGGG